ncbi:hypothetical protein HYN59_09665 [Flavobacterium album]|uniref:Lipid/polyisoprenoid-binding YceI-like domain-containing protein n=1 Tax=Flavobacterium album TaxID=2175091 RepID=A0A2S1QYA2_9FLAO|nr:YceI family protein [Flavobacterium album]AWH85365.1 hypothetical protein HYN59_09665 [Flavobacterium album]
MATKNWTLDPAHSDIHFKIRHLFISSVTGEFKIFSGTMVTPQHDNFNGASFKLFIDAFSVDTNNRDRDEHLKSPDFFSADLFPQLEFHSTAFSPVAGDNYRLKGVLTIKGISKEIMLDVFFGGEAKDGFGINRAGFEIIGTINRNDFDIHPAGIAEVGGLVLGEEIKLHANIQFTNDTE